MILTAIVSDEIVAVRKHMLKARSKTRARKGGRYEVYIYKS